MVTNDETRLGKCEVKAVAMPPPRLYPTMLKRPELEPVHESGDVARTRRI